MRENEWTAAIAELLRKSEVGDSIGIDTRARVPYARETLCYDLAFRENQESTMAFETDLLIYEKTSVIKPRVIIEAKVDQVSTHDAITYSYKAQHHKGVTPYIRYGIMLGNRRHFPLPGRLFRHGMNFDFMISFREYLPNAEEETAFIELIQREIAYSKSTEEMIYDSRRRSRRRYFLLQKELRLEEMR
jgi:hypothetical protein